MTLSQMFMLYRKSERMTLQQLSHKSGVAIATLQALEMGRIREPKFTTALRIADALGLEITYVADHVRAEMKKEMKKLYAGRDDPPNPTA